MRQLSANALTTISAARLMTGAAEDDISTEKLVLLINKASASVETAIERQLRQQDRTEKIVPDGSQTLLMNHYPIVSVARVTQEGSELDPSCYEIQAEKGMLWKDDGWRWSGYPAGLAYDPVFASRNVTVEYTAGYILPKDETDEQHATLPADLEGLVLEMVQDAWAKLTGGAAGLKAFAISDVRWDWNTDVPQGWRDTIEHHKRW